MADTGTNRQLTKSRKPIPLPGSRGMRTAVIAIVAMLLQACISAPERQPVPEQYLSEASIPGIKYARLSMTNVDSLAQLEPEELSTRLREKVNKLAAGASLYPDFLANSI